MVRGSQQGESHGGIYSIDFHRREARQLVDWNTCEIDFEGRGWDRGLRGIAFGRDRIFIAASDELFAYDRGFEIQASYRNAYLRHCHEIFSRGHLLLVTSTGFDSLLVFDLRKGEFVRGLHLARENKAWACRPFDPSSEQGPPFSNHLHINSVYADDGGVYVSGLRTGALLHIGGKLDVSVVCDLPRGAHNARPFRNGVLFNDTEADLVRYAGRDGKNVSFPVPVFDPEDIEFAGVDDSKIARQGFGRGLCPFQDRFVAAGSSPSTVSVYDLVTGERVVSVNLSMDVRNAIHGLEAWPDDAREMAA